MGGAAEGSVESATRLHARGLAGMEAGQPRVAVRHLRRAWTMLERDRAASAEDRARVSARVLITLANAEFELDGLAPALKRLDTAAAVVLGSGLRDLEVSLHNQRGLFLLRVGRHADALAEFDRAEECFAPASQLERAKVLLNRGTVHLGDGRLSEARSDLRRSAEVAQAAELDALQLKALHNLGYVEFLAGDLPRALELMASAHEIGADVSPGIALLDRARVLGEAGLVVEADDALREAAVIFRRERLIQDLAETELERARCALLMGDATPARRHAATARELFRRRGNERWRRAAELSVLQSDLAARRPGRTVAAPALRLRDELAAEGLVFSAATAGRIAVEALLDAGQPVPAAQLLNTVGSAVAEPISARLHDRYVRAQVDIAQGDRRGAAQQVRAGLADLARYQSSFGSIDLQTAAAVHGSRLAELGVLLALDTGRPAAVFAAAERARSVSARLAGVRPPADAVVAELLSELRHVVEALRAIVQDAERAIPLHRRRRELERAISARRWAIAGSLSARRQATPEEVRAELADQALTMLMFAEANGSLHAIEMAPDRTRLYALGRAATATELVRRIRADLDVLAQPGLAIALASAVRASAARTLEALDGTLLARSRIDGGGLVVISTGVLGQLPWGAMPSLRGVPVVVAPSATAWLRACEAAPRRRRFSVTALAGPDLTRASHEVKAIGDVWGERASIPDPTGRTFAAAMARSSVVHVAAHGVHHTENPLFSSLRLADGPLFAHELDQTARTPEHVVLSACELGLATVRPGDEALGLTSVLLHLGTRSVVAGVARVGDELAEQTMVDYHRRLAAGADSATALAGATEHATVPFVCFGSAWSAPKLATGFGGARRGRVA